MEYPVSNQYASERSRGDACIDFVLRLSPFERLLFTLLALATFVSGFLLLYRTNDTTLIETPRAGGIYVEGITGTPRFINPLLAISDADKDLTRLVYAGLMTRNERGELVPELAESYSVSEDGLIYTFTLREGLTFHDGTPLTAEDVVFTVRQASDSALLSPVYANWENADVEQTDDRTIVFTLPEPYVPFLGNTTLGILPKHIWEGVSVDEYRFSQFNVTPVGAGAYQVLNVVRDKSGIPAQYELASFPEYTLGAPHIESIIFKLFDKKTDALTALTTGEVHAVGGVPYAELATLADAETSAPLSVRRVPLLRTFALFLNHNRQPLLLRKEVRKALDIATPKEALVGEVLSGYGTVLSGPLPPFVVGSSTATTSESSSENTETDTEYASSVELAQSILEDAGWKKNAETGIYEREIDKEVQPLSITLSALNTPELTMVAERTAESWRAVGIQVELNVFNSADLVQSVVRPRKFDILLYGMVLGHELDLYAFWHSSQRNDPGLNIAQYADIEADALFEKMRAEQDDAVRKELYTSFNTLAGEQRAALFLYTPDYVYVVRDGIHNLKLHPISEANERFDTVHTWYIDTDRVWPIVEPLLD